MAEGVLNLLRRLLYHGSPTALHAAPELRSNRMRGIAATPFLDVARGYAGPRGRVWSGQLDPRARILDMTDDTQQLSPDMFDALRDSMGHRLDFDRAHEALTDWDDPTKNADLSWFDLRHEMSNPFIREEDTVPRADELSAALRSLGYHGVADYDTPYGIYYDVSRRFGKQAAQPLGEMQAVREAHDYPTLHILDPTMMRWSGAP